MAPRWAKIFNNNHNDVLSCLRCSGGEFDCISIYAITISGAFIMRLLHGPVIDGRARALKYHLWWIILLSPAEIKALDTKPAAIYVYEMAFAHIFMLCALLYICSVLVFSYFMFPMLQQRQSFCETDTLVTSDAPAEPCCQKITRERDPARRF